MLCATVLEQLEHQHLSTLWKRARTGLSVTLFNSVSRTRFTKSTVSQTTPCTCGTQRSVYASCTFPQSRWLSARTQHPDRGVKSTSCEWQTWISKTSTTIYLIVSRRPEICDGWSFELSNERRWRATAPCPVCGRALCTRGSNPRTVPFIASTVTAAITSAWSESRRARSTAVSIKETTFRITTCIICQYIFSVTSQIVLILKNYS